MMKNHSGADDIQYENTYLGLLKCDVLLLLMRTL